MTWEWDKEAWDWFWSQKSMENLKPQVLASTLMAQRPIARTALRTKSTSTSVAYSFSSARTCKESTSKWTPGWQGMPPKHQNTSRMYSSTANHAHPKLTLSKPWYQSLPLKPMLLGGNTAWIRQADSIQGGWSQKMAPSFPWQTAGGKISPAKLNHCNPPYTEDTVTQSWHTSQTDFMQFVVLIVLHSLHAKLFFSLLFCMEMNPCILIGSKKRKGFKDIMEQTHTRTRNNIKIHLL